MLARMRRPAWWLVLAALALLAVAVPFARREQRERRVAAKESAPAPSATVSAVPPAIVDAEADAGPAWPPTALRVLHVGDSTLGFSQGLASEMSARFAALGIRYDAYTDASAGLHSFASSRRLSELIREKKPDVVLLTLGMNNLTALHPEQYEVDVRAIVLEVGARPCWWIGPLSIDRPENGLIALLARATAPCAWTSSYDLAIERQPDAIHPTQRGASRWADVIWGVLGPVAPREP